MREILEASIGKPPFKLENKDLLTIISAFIIFLIISYFFIFLASHNFKERLIIHYEDIFKSNKDIKAKKVRLTLVDQKLNKPDLKHYEFPLMETIILKSPQSDKLIQLLVFSTDKDYYYSKIKEGFKIKVLFYREGDTFQTYYPKKYKKNVKDSINNIKFTTFLLSYLKLSDEYKLMRDSSIKRDIASLRNRDQNLDVFSFLVFILLIFLKLTPRLRKYFKRRKLFKINYKEEDLLKAPSIEVINLSTNESSFESKYHKKDYFYRVTTDGEFKNLIVAFDYKKRYSHLSGRLLKYQDEYFFIPSGLENLN